MRVLFFGTSAFAVPSLKTLLRSAHKVTGVVTQPDKPAGRGRKLTPPPVADAARALGLPLLQPATLKDEGALATIRQMHPDCIAVVAYGNFLPQALIALPPKRCVNVHPSLLPKYRGAAPINWAILNGDTITGVTTMYVAMAMDSGDMLLQREVAIHPDESAADLSARLAPLGGELLVQTLDQIAGGQAKPISQNVSKVVLAPALAKADGLIDWRKPARELINHIRGMQPWPNAYTHLDNQQCTIYRAEVLDELTDAAPGMIVRVSRVIHVATGDEKQLCLTEVQLAGKKRMSVQEFLRGFTMATGTLLT